MGRDPVISLESVPVCILVGTVLGFLSGLGIGGGSLLILWLTAAVSMDQRMAQGVNLLFFLPAALTGLLFHSRHGAWHGKRRCRPLRPGPVRRGCAPGRQLYWIRAC